MSEEFWDHLDELEEERSLSYDRFDRYGDDFIDVMSDGVSNLNDEVWVSADEILEASDEERGSFKEASGNRIFTSIYNLLCEIDLLPAFHDSEPYEIRPSGYEQQNIVDAWKYVSGKKYREQDEQIQNLEDKPPEQVDSLY